MLFTPVDRSTSPASNRDAILFQFHTHTAPKHCFRDSRGIIHSSDQSEDCSLTLHVWVHVPQPGTETNTATATVNSQIVARNFIYLPVFCFVLNVFVSYPSLKRYLPFLNDLYRKTSFVFGAGLICLNTRVYVRIYRV